MKFRTLAICVLVLAIAAPAAFAKSPVKPGKWQWTMQMDIPGMPMKMPPFTFEHCVTKEDAEKADAGVPKDKRQSKDCTLGDYKVDGNTVKWTVDCPKQKMTGKGEVTYDGDSMEGKMEMVTEDTTMTTKYSGKYLGECDK